MASSTSGTVTKAVASALANAGGVYGVVISTSGAPNTSIKVAIAGTLPPIATGLGLASGPVRCNTTTARLERVATLAGADYPVGYADAAGFVTLLRIGTGIVAAATSRTAALDALIDANHTHFYKCNDAAGATTVADTGSGTNTPLTIVTATSGGITTPRLGSIAPFGTAAFTGIAAGYVSALAPADITSGAFLSTATVEGWFNQNYVQPAGGQALFGVSENTNGVSFGLQISGAAVTFTFSVHSPFVNSQSANASAPNQGANTWRHGMISFGGGLALGYIDGELVSTTAAAAPIVWGVNPSIFIGGSSQATAVFPGYLGRVGYSNIARPQSYARAITKAGLGY